MTDISKAHEEWFQNLTREELEDLVSKAPMMKFMTYKKSYPIKSEDVEKSLDTTSKTSKAKHHE